MRIPQVFIRRQLIAETESVYKSGFEYAGNLGLCYHDMPEDTDNSFFLCRELISGYLDGVTGVDRAPRGYDADDADAEAYDRND